MIDMELFLTLMGAPTYSGRLSEEEKPAFLDNRIIDEQGVRAVPVESQTFQLLTETEREQLTLDEINSELKFPCSLDEFRYWVVNNGYEIFSEIELANYMEGLNTLANIKAKRSPTQIFIEQLKPQDIKPWDGKFESLVSLYRFKIAIENDKRKTEADRHQGKQFDLATYEARINRLNNLLKHIDNAINEQPKHIDSEDGVKPLSRREQQFQMIEAFIKDFDFDIMNIPYHGKSKIKQRCVNEFKHLFTSSVFDKAWSEFSRDGHLSIANKNSFIASKK